MKVANVCWLEFIHTISEQVYILAAWLVLTWGEETRCLCFNKMYQKIIPFHLSLLLYAFPSCRLSSIQIMANFAKFLLYVKARLSSLTALWNNGAKHFTKLQTWTASLLQKTNIRPCFVMIWVGLRLEEGKGCSCNDKGKGMICLHISLKNKHLVSSCPCF